MLSMRKLTVLGSALALALAAAPAAAQSAPQRPNWTRKPSITRTTSAQQAGTPGDLTKSPEVRQRLEAVHAVNEMQIQLGKMAKEKGQSTAVKQLGDRMVREHETIDRQLMDLASRRGLKLQQETGKALGQRRDAEAADLKGAKAEEFDRKYLDFEAGMSKEIEDHFKALRDSTQGQDAELKKWLDDQENRAEANLAAVREARSQLQRQGRTPAK
jgi:putative membrane protein